MIHLFQLTSSFLDHCKLKGHFSFFQNWEWLFVSLFSHEVSFISIKKWHDKIYLRNSCGSKGRKSPKKVLTFKAYSGWKYYLCGWDNRCYKSWQFMLQHVGDYLNKAGSKQKTWWLIHKRKRSVLIIRKLYCAKSIKVLKHLEEVLRK